MKTFITIVLTWFTTVGLIILTVNYFFLPSQQFQMKYRWCGEEIIQETTCWDSGYPTFDVGAREVSFYPPCNGMTKIKNVCDMHVQLDMLTF